MEYIYIYSLSLFLNVTVVFSWCVTLRITFTLSDLEVNLKLSDLDLSVCLKFS